MPNIYLNCRTGEAMKLSVSGAPGFFHCQYRNFDPLLPGSSYVMLCNELSRGTLEVPAGTPWQLCAMSGKPDIYMVAFHLPDHPDSLETCGLLGVILRRASYYKLANNNETSSSEET